MPGTATGALIYTILFYSSQSYTTGNIFSILKDQDCFIFFSNSISMLEMSVDNLQKLDERGGRVIPLPCHFTCSFTLYGFSHLWATRMQKYNMENSRSKQSIILNYVPSLSCVDEMLNHPTETHMGPE